jgi:hypothetical protein
MPDRIIPSMPPSSATDPKNDLAIVKFDPAAAVGTGNSGGPVLDGAGSVVGVMVSQASVP